MTTEETGGWVDLHTHSSASDGSLSPDELVQEARKAGLCAIALTDHDTTDGLAEALETGDSLGVEVVPGLELSAWREQTGSWHLLGLWIDPADERLQATLAQVRRDRRMRNDRIFGLLKDLGVPIDPECVQLLAGDGPVGRPHIARVLVDRGHAESVKQAFERFLARDRPAYVPRKLLSPEAAIGLIRGARGIAVLAHPFHPLRSVPQVLQEIDRLRQSGLSGLEVWHPAHTPEQTRILADLASERDLAASGGSDFHGGFKPDQPLGRPAVSERVLEGLRSKLLLHYQ